VDSSVCAALLHRALQPDQVIALHVDNGFMRQDESRKVEESLKALGLHLNGQLTLFNLQSLQLTWLSDIAVGLNIVSANFLKFVVIAYAWWFITFCVKCSRSEMYIGHGRLCVCLSVCPSPHSYTTAQTPM